MNNHETRIILLRQKYRHNNFLYIEFANIMSVALCVISIYICYEVYLTYKHV